MVDKKLFMRKGVSIHMNTNWIGFFGIFTNRPKETSERIPYKRNFVIYPHYCPSSELVYSGWPTDR